MESINHDTAHVILSLGSCCRPTAHIQWASQWLQQTLSDAKLSKTLWTADIKGFGRMYMNRLISGYTSLSLDALQQTLKAAEKRCGRTAEAITLDIDVMQYDHQQLHLRDWPRPYIQLLINEI